MPLWDKRQNILLLTALVVFHLILISIQIPRGQDKSLFEKSVFFVFSPVQRAAVGAVRGVRSFWLNYFDLRGVRAENRKLKEDHFFLQQENRFLQDRLGLFRSEARIRESLERFRDDLIPARVIGIDSSNPFRSLVLDKGSLDGVKKNMAVCDKFGNLVGRTIDPVSLREAMVQLITDKESSVSVISETDRLVGSITGLSGSVCELRYVLASTTGGAVGEDLQTTGHDRIYPAGLRVGRIASIQKDPSLPLFRKILVQPHFQFNTLDAVAVLPQVQGGDK
jgi:rod shape-determining protein MreC